MCITWRWVGGDSERLTWSWQLMKEVFLNLTTVVSCLSYGVAALSNGSREIFTIKSCEQAPDQLSLSRFTKLLIVQGGSLWLPSLTSGVTQARNFPHHFCKGVVLFCSISECSPNSLTCDLKKAYILEKHPILVWSQMTNFISLGKSSLLLTRWGFFNLKSECF